MPNLKNLVKALAITSVVGLTPFAFAPAASADMMSLLSKGYGPSNCQNADLITDAVAVVSCQSNPLPGGPTATKYVQYGSSSDLSKHFRALIAEDSTFPCEQGQSAPHKWNYKSTPDEVAGFASCGTYKGTPELVWTNEANNLLVTAQGNDINAMYNWWLANG